MTKFTQEELKDFRDKLQDLNQLDMNEFMELNRGLNETAPELYSQMLQAYDEIVWHRINHPGIRTEAV